MNNNKQRMKRAYVMPGIERFRVVLEENMADTVTISALDIVGSGTLTKDDWNTGTAQVVTDGDILLPTF